jgi:chromosomal replication initiator protein
VVGGSNHFAHAAALAVAQTRRRLITRCFLYGGVGLGKRTSCTPSAMRVKGNDPSARVMYVDQRAFSNELITAIPDG